jgi:mannose-6-phosphate isomerase-like protein (cupin superfamily)
MGATLFEKHVGVPTEKYAINAYSATPQQVRRWLESASDAVKMTGDPKKRYPAPEGEQAALRDLARGAFVKAPVLKGDTIEPANVFFAMPNIKGQLVAQDFSKYSRYIACEDISANGAVMEDKVGAHNTRALVFKIVMDVKNLIRKSKVQVPGQCDLEISHHYGLENFRETGITAITVVNREYCKRLMVVLPGQKHPEQWHNQKDETYHILYGDVTVNLDGKTSTHKSNSVITISHGIKHSFWTTSGAIIEEVSSSYSMNDSFYTDPAIMANTNRKTFVTYWIG